MQDSDSSVTILKRYSETGTEYDGKEGRIVVELKVVKRRERRLPTSTRRMEWYG